MRHPKRQRLLRRLRDFVFSWAPVIGIVLATRAFVVEAVIVPTGSMTSTIRTGDCLLVNKFLYGIRMPFTNRELVPVSLPRRGDVVMFRAPAEPDWPQPEDNYIRIFPKWLPLFPVYWCKQDNPGFRGHRRGFVTYSPQNLVKRCVALPGDTVEIRDKRLYVNGLPATDDKARWVRPGVIPARTRDWDSFQQQWEEMGCALDPGVRDNFGPVVIPPDQFMALGDNRDNSWDSRFWGPVPRKYLKGKPLVAFFSYRFPTLPGVDESEVDGTKVPLREILTHPFNIRLNRIGRLIS